MEICKALLGSAMAAMMLGAGFSASAAPGARTYPDHVTLAQLDAEQARQELIDFELAPIKSANDLAAYLKAAGPESPFMGLTPGARERFIGSLVFNENGLVSFQYGDLSRELTASQAYRLLSLFGAQRTTYRLGARVESEADAAVSQRSSIPKLRADHTDYKCTGRANCYASMLYICMSGC